MQIKMLQFTASEAEQPVWINADHILLLRSRPSGGTTIELAGTATTLDVREDVQKVVQAVEAAHAFR